MLFSWSLSVLSVQQLMQDKICIHHYNQSKSYCHDLGLSPEDSIKSSILSDAVNYAVYGTILETIPMVIYAISMGPFCNKYIFGRKMFMMCGVFSCVVRDILMITNSIFFDLNVYFVVLSFISTVIGSYHAAITCVYSYLSLYVDESNRTFKLMVQEAVIAIAWGIGPIAGALLIDLSPLFNIGNNQVYNYVGVFLCCLTCDLIAFIWVFFTINEKKPQIVNVDVPESSVTMSSNINGDVNSNLNESIKILNLQTSVKQVSQYNAKSCNPVQIQPIGRNSNCLFFDVIKDLFNPFNVGSLLKTVFKERPNGARSRLLLTFFCLELMNFSYKGIDRTKYPISEHLYHWDPVFYSYIFTAGTLFAGFCLLCFTPLLTKLCKLNDYEIAIIGCLSATVGYTMASSLLIDLGTYLLYLLGALTSLAPSSTKSMLSKLVPSEDVTKIYATQAILDAIIPSVGAAAYSTLFHYSLEVFPTAIFLSTAVCHLITMCFYMNWDLDTRRKQSTDQ